VSSADPSHGRPSVSSVVAEALLAHDLPDATQEERGAAIRYVEESLAAMPDFTQSGVRVTGRAVFVILSAMGGGRYRTLPPRCRTALAVALFERPVPAVNEFGKLVRGLSLVGALEMRYRSENGPMVDDQTR
jgi:hypothetical protein